MNDNRSTAANQRTQNPQATSAHRIVLICALIWVVLLAACREKVVDDTISASGFIEAEEVILAAETSGRITEMPVDRGDPVGAGDIVVRLDDAVLQSQLLQAKAGLAAANAELERVLAGERREKIAAAQATLRQIEAQRDGAAQAVANAQDVIVHPLALDAEIATARARVSIAEQKVAMAMADLQETELKRQALGVWGGESGRIWDLQVQASRAALAQAQIEQEGAQKHLDLLWSISANPLILKAQLHAAETEYRITEAQVTEAQAALAELKAGPTAQEVAVAEAQVRRARAAVRLVEAQIAQLTLTAPTDGVVTSRIAEAGETVSAGAPLLSIADLGQVELVVYIPANRIGQVRLGQEMKVRVDSFPKRTFSGQVTNIAQEAEFTPRNVQTPEERARLVFAVKAQILNPEDALKAGMPADATIELATGANDTPTGRTITEAPTYTPYSTYTPAPAIVSGSTPTPEPTETVEPTATAEPSATRAAVTDAEALVTANVLNLRAGPGIHFAKLGHVHQSDQIKILGKNPEGTWIKVAAPDGTEAWVILTHVKMSTSLNDVPVAEVPPAPLSAP